MTHKIQENPAQNFIICLLESHAETAGDLSKAQREESRKHNHGFFQKDELITAYRALIKTGTIKPNQKLEKLLRLKETRSFSGIVVVSVLTKPFPCPGNCLYCPTQKNTPKSYLPNEPAVMRAISCNYHPFKQVMTRLSSLHSTGHPIDKINIRIIGGTWSYYPQQYQTWFVKELFHACNEFGLPTTNNQKPKTNTLEILQKQNEAARCRVVEISIETRQDHISIKEIKRLRELGVTKVELGVQSLYDDVLRLNRRGNTDQETVTATKLLRDAGFKVSYQMMPNLPGSDLNQDLQMFRDLFSNPSYKPDYLKIYPLALVKEAPLFSWSKRHNFIPYTETELTDLLCGIKQHVPRYCRIERVIRDIPAEMIVAGGAKVSNLRQIVLEKLKKTKQNCQCIRCREIRSDFPEDNQHKMFCETYEANGGMEHFLTIESPDRQTLYALLRLRIPPQDADLPYSSLKETALVREIHTYGRQLPVGVNDMHAAQHRGFGRLLLAQAEQIARNTPNIKRISVISGVGVRNYFRKFGFELSDTYMAKEL